MAISSTLVGKLGGATVDVWTGSLGRYTSATTVRTVTVSAGETWLIAASLSSSGQYDQVRIDGRVVVSGQKMPEAIFTKAGPASVPVQVITSQKSGNTLTVYSVKLS